MTSPGMPLPHILYPDHDHSLHQKGTPGDTLSPSAPSPEGPWINADSLRTGPCHREALLGLAQVIRGGWSVGRYSGRPSPVQGMPPPGPGGVRCLGSSRGRPHDGRLLHGMSMGWMTITASVHVHGWREHAQCFRPCGRLWPQFVRTRISEGVTSMPSGCCLYSHL